jgi:hypothetical protein
MFGGMMRRYATLFQGFRELTARDLRAAERTRRISSVADGFVEAWRIATRTPPGQKIPMLSSGSGQMSVASSNATVPTENCFNITSIDVCIQCFAVNQWLGYTAQNTRQLVWYYNVSNTTQFTTSSSPANFSDFGPNPQVANSFAYAYATFQFMNNYTINQTRVPLFVGNSASNPARFPSQYVPVWDYLDDTVPNKTAFRAYQPLFNATWEAILELLANIDVFSNVQTTTTVSTSGSGMTAAGAAPHISASGVDTSRFRPRDTTSSAFDFNGMVLHGVGTLARALLGTPTSQSIAVSTTKRTLPAEFDTFQEILEGWYQLIVNEFIYCRYDSELDGTNIRYSLLQGALLVGIPAILLGWLVAAVPAVEFLTLFFVVPGILRGIIQLIGPLIAVGFWIGFTTGWKILCFPSLPPVLFTTQFMQLLSTSVLVNKCPVIGGGLTKETSFNNQTCMVCDNWRNGVFTLYSCRDDLGWSSPFDPLVFWLKVCQGTDRVCSGWLTALQTPSDWNVFFSAILRLPIISQWLHKWDDVDLSTEVGYSSQLTCGFIMSAASVIILTLLGLLIAFGPVFQILALILALCAIVLVSAVMLVFALFVVLYAILSAGPTLVRKGEKIRLQQNGAA